MHNTTSNYNFRLLEIHDLPIIWKIVQEAINRRKLEGSTQWQEGYPNLESIENDLKRGFGYVLEMDGKIAAYSAIIFEIEPAYEIIVGKWESSGNYAVIHRVAVGNDFTGNGVATQVFKEIERVVMSQQIFTIKVDTNFDNVAMLKIFKKLQYEYRGKVYFRGSERLAFEKILQLT
ncbi:GNAT family N-acetyltransferase [Chryseobacterium sp. MP_3.2]|uniref:GNAT family N-acetyltransferase n=1 Tax=Chryseobacterium sp. MP_3.2 TaxID=3071712 RepID=UPI002E0A5CC6|nr:GNAT superfamily N-acetyltransferase [Chryseobacterium sp. MP_3.2]